MRKKMAFSLIISSAALFVHAQHVGIGNTDPGYRLDISGRARIRGGANESFTAGIWLGGIKADSATNKIFMGMESDSSAGFYSELNATGWFLVANGKHGRLGIRNRDPKYPLSFDNQGGDKISLYQDGNGNFYGMGIGNSTLQLMTPHSSSSIVLGTGTSGNFTENMRINGNGLVGIGESNPALAGLVVNKKVGGAHAIFGSNTTGVAIESSYPGIGFNNYYNGGRKTMATGFGGYIGVNPQAGGMSLLVSEQSNNAGSMGTYKTAIEIKPSGHVGIGISDPVYPLDIANRMRIRGAPGFSAGIWLNNEGNTAIPAFIGLQADNQVGFYGSGTGWSFLMNTTTGAISFGGNAGQPGQVLASNGSGGVPQWRNIGGGTHAEVFQTSNLSVSANSGYVTVPGLEANFSLTTTSRVVMHARLMLSISACFACAPNKTYIALRKVVPGGYEEHMVLPKTTAEGELDNFSSGPIVLNLAAGSYSYVIAIRNVGPTSTATAVMQSIGGGTYPGVLTWQIFPN